MTLATVDHSLTKHCPILTAGDITPKALRDLQDAHNKFFIVKEIDNDGKVKKILAGFKDIHICDWIASDSVHLLALSYKNFMSELRANYLPSDWEANVRTHILSMCMTKDTRFWDWSQEMRAQNIILRGLPSYFDDNTICNQLETGLDPMLRNYCVCEKINAVVVLKDWIDTVKRADEQMKDKRKRSREMAEEVANSRGNKHQALLSNS
ncbi:hypothetical protein B0H34DRAFT_797160 [Crassisporium funariophilum]|nr:hypothetical protein B0H34DRAFT_797160 [Crassisporium funariophilum]